MKTGFGPTTSTPRALELAPVRVEEPRRAVEADRGLAGAGAALDDEEPFGSRVIRLVLVGLDRRDDVAHVLVAAALELLEQDVGDAVDDLACGAVERLVVEVEQLPAVDAEAPAQRDARGSATVAV